MNMNEHQETIDKLRGIVSEKTDDISNIQMNLENTNTTLKAQIQELQEKEHQLLLLIGKLDNVITVADKITEDTSILAARKYSLFERK